jgi:hypothetical protein
MPVSRPLVQDRRRYQRITKPIDATYRGRSGPSRCRIADISWGGCFIQTLSTPSHDEATIVSVPLRNGSLDVSGRVLYVEPAMGFAVKFDPLNAAAVEGLAEILGEAPAELLKQRS